MAQSFGILSFTVLAGVIGLTVTMFFAMAFFRSSQFPVEGKVGYTIKRIHQSR